MKILRSRDGLTILYQRVDSSLVDMRFVITCGAIDELEPTDHGLCHALEHMLFAGTKTRTWLDVNREWEKVGANFNAFTGQDKTLYVATSVKSRWAETFEVLADVVYNPTLPEERWEGVEKGAILSEIQGFYDDEVNRLNELVYGHALGSVYHPVDGNQDNIRNAKVEDLKKFYDLNYTTNNTVLVLCGDLSEDKILKVVNKYTHAKDTSRPARKKLNFNFNYGPLKAVVPEMEQVLIDVLKPVPYPSTLRSQVALRIGSQCLQQYLFEELREKRGLCYGAHVLTNKEIPGHFFLKIETATDKERLVRMRRALRSSLETFIDQGLTTERVENMKARDKMLVTGDSENIMSCADFVWEAWENQVYSDPFQAVIGITDAIDSGTVRRAMRKALDGKMKIATMLSED